ncbi:MAG: hypothetical protein QM496_21740 [Verrucomicrobiota bacterium]
MDHVAIAKFEERLFVFGKEHFSELIESDFEDLKHCQSSFTETVISYFQNHSKDEQR